MGFLGGIRRTELKTSGLVRILALGFALAVAPAFALASVVPPNNTKLTTKTEFLANKRIMPMLNSESASNLDRLAERYRTIVSEGDWPKVPKGSYKKGKKGKGVRALNARLFAEGYLRVEGTQGEFAEIFTTATADSVMRFQRNHGIEVSGKVDKSTLQALNVSAADRLATIEANVERLRKYSEGLGDRYIIVNVPSQQIEAVSNGFVYSRHNAIVGRPDRPTPVVETALSDVVFNPYWNAPSSIVERDLIPLILSGKDVFSEMNIKVFKGFGGPEVDPETVDWRSAVAEAYHFRQEPGENNAMATAKINFPSPFGIYLHDTPDQYYFKTGHRFYSSGCVRVEKVDILLNWILNGQDGIGSSQIASLAETRQNTEVKLVAPPQLRVTYLTAYPVGDTVAFFEDVYDLDGSGFVVGQPMAVGELSDDGQRFVLTHVKRKASAVDEAEADGFNLFSGSGKSKSKPKIKSTGGIYESEVFDGTVVQPQPQAKKSRKPKVPAASESIDVVDAKPAPKKAIAAKAVALAKPVDPEQVSNKVVAKKKRAGLFDWEAYRKEQAALAGKPPAKKAGVKQVKLKKTADPKIVAKKPGAKTTADCKPDSAGKLPKACPPLKTAEKKKP